MDVKRQSGNVTFFVNALPTKMDVIILIKLKVPGSIRVTVKITGVKPILCVLVTTGYTLFFEFFKEFLIEKEQKFFEKYKKLFHMK